MANLEYPVNRSVICEGDLLSSVLLEQGLSFVFSFRVYPEKMGCQAVRGTTGR